MEAIQVAEVRSKGWSYRAEMYPVYKPSYVGASPLTKYFVFNREWKEVPYNVLPTTAYQALRRALKVDMAKGPMRDPKPKRKCSCGEAAAHVVSKGKTYDGIDARLWNDGLITDRLGRTRRGYKLPVQEMWRAWQDIGVYTWEEIPDLIAKARRSVIDRD